MVFKATHHGSRSLVALKALPEDSNEFKLFAQLYGGDPGSASLQLIGSVTGSSNFHLDSEPGAVAELRVVPLIALIPPFTVYEGCTMRAVCMPMLTSLAGAIANGKVPCSNVVLVDISIQLLQVPWYYGEFVHL